MNTTPINNASANYFESTLGTNGKTSKAPSSDSGLSTFAQLLGTSTSSTTAGGSSNTNSPNQMLAQLMSSFQASGIQNEGSSVDPMAIG